MGGDGSEYVDCKQLPTNEWQQCPQGELLHVRERLCAHARRTCRIVRLAALGVLLAFVGGGVWGVSAWQAASSHALKAIDCEECAQHFAEYRDHLLGLHPFEDAGLLRKIEAHMTNCPKCRDRFEKEYPGVLNQQTMDSLRRGPRQLAFCCQQPPVAW